MNPKIKDFAEHCDFYVGNEHYNESYEEKQRLWLEKFADMIIEEVHQVIVVGGVDDLYGVKKHFEVE
jgi:hypothetical protein